MLSYFDYSAEVKNAVAERKPIVALESTIITHGMPYPQNLETAKLVEQMVRDHHAIPATIAILNGKIKIGLSIDELDELVNNKQVVKASKRDIPYVLSKKLSAGTTVASTLFCADFAGIRVFATGGIGGVHRGDDYDVSADLTELARTPVAVVCAGAKAILDLPKTLEFLETYSIPVIGYRTDCLPAFYSATTAYSLPARVDDVKTLAKILKIHWQLGLPSGVLITNPIPSEDEIPAEKIEPAIAKALQKAEKNRVSGKEMTPFLLAEISQITRGKSLAANIQLIKNNVKMGAELAVAIQQI